MKLKAITFLILGWEINVSWQQIQWNDNAEGSWALNCDFRGNDIGMGYGSGGTCSTMCIGYSGCTHYAWFDGTCYYKGGSVSKSDAFLDYSKPGLVCGIVNKNGGGGNGPNKGPLVWADDFNSLAEVNSKWIQETGGHGWGNNELQYYTDNNHNIQTSAGFLTINTRIENYGGRGYTSARLISRNQFRYGVFEMRAKLPYGRGTWPAFWLLAANRPLNWPSDGEIDIMEHVGYDMNVVHATIHCGAYNHMIGTQIGRSTRVDDVANQFHLYQVEWRADKIIGFIDNKEYFRYEKPGNTYSQWPFDNNFNIILNTAVGGDWGGAMGIDNGIFPQNYVIDYVHIYA